MASLIRNLVDYYNYLLYEKAESRILDMPLINSPLPIIFINFLYLHFIKISGPKFMEKRKPFELKNVMILNNAAQCFVNFWCCWQGIMLLLSPQYNFKCTVMAPTTGPHELQEIWLSWFYFMVKVWDLTDTIFMVLRKNYHQVTFLHVYHHIGMDMGGWLVVRYLPGGHLILVGTINCFVHTIMYFYYLLTAYNPELKKSIWWKKHITELQMVQFTIILVHHSWAFFDATCKYPKIPLAIFMSQNFFIIYLFSRFYYNTYIKDDKNEKNR